MEPGVPLKDYRDQADVLLICEPCNYWRTIPLEDVIARINARGLDGENVGIVELARLTTQPCPRCGARKWETRPAFPDIPGRMGLPSP